MKNQYINFFTRFFFSTSHKDIGSFYSFGLFAGLIGSVFSVLIRMELSYPGNQFFNGDYQFYNVVVTAHGLLKLKKQNQLIQQIIQKQYIMYLYLYEKLKKKI